MNIAALVSGGVDSSVVVYRLKEMGYNPTIFYIRIGMEDENGYMGCSAEEDIELTSFIAKKYGLKMEIVSLQTEYWEQVVDYTLKTVKMGLTPNPDIMCNKLIKFGSFNQKYGKDFDKIATGHYANTTIIDGKYYLATAVDKRKDQTYFLSRINYGQLSKLMFPIGDLPKYKVRELAFQEGLPSAARKDSQGICFLGKVNYNDFIKKYIGTKIGKIVELETGKILGQHNGLWFHTIGQRKGLGLSGGPWYVVAKNIEENIVYVSNGYDPATQYGTSIPLDDFLFITKDTWGCFEGKQRIAFKIRHTPEFTFGSIEIKNGKYYIDSEEKIQGIAPGQFCAVYDESCAVCLGSGVIAEYILPDFLF